MAAIPLNLGVPTGTVMWTASPSVPVGWLLCDGRYVSKANHPALYLNLGATYGEDEFAFGLPDLVGRFIEGVGTPGRAPFTYEDGLNKEHLHGMFPNQTHTHGVTDPGHEHPTSSGAHFHNATSDHSHGNTSDHDHDPRQGTKFKTHTYIAAVTCNREVYAPLFGGGGCGRDAGDFFITNKEPFLPWPYNPKGLTGITQVNANVTGTSVEIAFTGVTLQNQFTGITLQFAQSNIAVDPVGVVGGPRPRNIAFLPIIRT